MTFPSPTSGFVGTPQPLLPLCDWTKSIANCRDAQYVRTLLLVSNGIHIASAMYGLWLLAYRNHGLNRKIFTSLFSYIGNGLQPMPFDCHIFFAVVAFAIKVPGNMFLIFDWLPNDWWFRIFLEQLYWVLVAFSFTSFFVGLLYAMPITGRSGAFVIYVPDAVPGAPPSPPIRILAPSAIQKNIVLVLGFVWPLICSLFGVVSGVLHNRGDIEGSKAWFSVQYSLWTILLIVLSVCFFYYGIKYMFILRANIVFAEDALNAPKLSFGINMLVTKSPARFLLATLHSTSIGGGLVTAAAALMTVTWLIIRDSILSRDNGGPGHIMAFLWTTGMAPAYTVTFILTHALSVRSKKRGLRVHHRTSTFIEDGCTRTEGRGKVIVPHYLDSDTKDLEADMLTMGELDIPSSLHLGDSSERWSSSSLVVPEFRCNIIQESDSIGGMTMAVRTISLNPPPRSSYSCEKNGHRISGVLRTDVVTPSALRETVFGGETSVAGARTTHCPNFHSSVFSLNALPFSSRRYTLRQPSRSPRPSQRSQSPFIAQRNGKGDIGGDTKDVVDHTKGELTSSQTSDDCVHVAPARLGEVDPA
ncbi:hypothetical protein BGZ94_007393 [Podila epigama]|nr:hypothetical protein BGZ94_007393 [Podila epigama]